MTRTLIAIVVLISVVEATAQTEIVKLKRLHQLIETKSDKIQVINFWATWCGPCVKELPLFEKVHASDPGVSITLVSLDLNLDPNPDKVYKFVARKNLQSRVMLLDEPGDPDAWIDSIDKAWSGALPATLVVNTQTGERKFIGTPLGDGDLEKIIEQLK